MTESARDGYDRRIAELQAAVEADPGDTYSADGLRLLKMFRNTTIGEILGEPITLLAAVQPDALHVVLPQKK